MATRRERAEEAPPERVFRVAGTPIRFPFQPYTSQMAIMNRVVQAMERSQNALIESPTGSGKSMALLCSTLAWRSQYAQRLVEEHQALVMAQMEEGNVVRNRERHATDLGAASRDRRPHDSGRKARGVAKAQVKRERDTDDVFGGDDDDDDDDDFQRSSSSYSHHLRTSQAATRSSQTASVTSTTTTAATATSAPNQHTNNGKTAKPPKIFYATRTHKQITQVVAELRRTFYRDQSMTILSSRDHTCIHRRVSRSSHKNDECRSLLSAHNPEQCPHFHNAHTLRHAQEFQPGGSKAVWDIEDLVVIGKRRRACPYFAAKAMVEDAGIVFCPYNYLIDPAIRKQMAIDLSNHVIVFDEAHNIEDVARDAASLEIELSTLEHIRDQLIEFAPPAGDCSSDQATTSAYAILTRIAEALIELVNSGKGTHQEVQFQKTIDNWTGVEAAVLLERCYVTPVTVDARAQDVAQLAELSRTAADAHMPHMGRRALQALEELFRVCAFLLIDNGARANDYHVAIVKETRQQQQQQQQSHQGQRRSRYKVNTAATVASTPTLSTRLCFWSLSPATAFRSLRDAARSIIVTSGTLAPLDTFSGELETEFRLRLEANHVIKSSQALVSCLTHAPDGQPITATFKHTQTLRFQDQIGLILLESVQVVPHGVLCFLSSYSLLDKLVQRWQQTGLLTRLGQYKIVLSEPHGHAAKADVEGVMRTFYTTIAADKGALMLAVCRGKLSEGIDFADARCRLVLTVGIPFPNTKDPKVECKRKYNEANSRTKGLLTGSMWYEIQAFRALNQALGRCIRHRKDWGAILMVDDRFSEERSRRSLSRWVREALVVHPRWNSLADSLRQFIDANTSRAPSPLPPAPLKPLLLSSSSALPSSTHAPNTTKRPLVEPEFELPPHRLAATTSAGIPERPAATARVPKRLRVEPEFEEEDLDVEPLCEHQVVDEIPMDCAEDGERPRAKEAEEDEIDEETLRQLVADPGTSQSQKSDLDMLGNYGDDDDEVALAAICVDFDDNTSGTVMAITKATATSTTTATTTTTPRPSRPIRQLLECARVRYDSTVCDSDVSIATDALFAEELPETPLCYFHDELGLAFRVLMCPACASCVGVRLVSAPREIWRLSHPSCVL